MLARSPVMPRPCIFDLDCILTAMADFFPSVAIKLNGNCVLLLMLRKTFSPADKLLTDK